MKSFKFAALLLLAPLLAVAGETGKARLVTGVERPVKCISSVNVYNIGGREVMVPALGFDVEPGMHSLMGRALINTSYCKAVGLGSNRYNAEPLEVEFEAGKTYYLGYDHSSSNRNDWKLVIWKVEAGDSPDQ